ncbi:MAG: hypothetical protein IKM59_07485 [Oscillospiraceae bacterium]|nr:hypothetical protein [Oscillospiraceae bacterium]
MDKTYDEMTYLPKSTKEKMEEVLERLQSREPFSYDVNTDKLYAKYKDTYSKSASLARKNAAAQAATLTGGYGNSYGQTLGQAAYDSQMDRLSDLIPELYDLAREDYDRESQALLDEYSLLEKDYREEQAAAEKARKEALEAQAAQEKKEKEEREQAYDLAITMLNKGLMPSEEVLDRSGLSQEDAKKLYDLSVSTLDSLGTGSTGKPGGGTSGGSSKPGSGSSGGSYGSGSGSGGSGSSGKSSGSSGASSKTEAGKALTNTLWEKLSSTYKKSQKAGEMTDFLQLRSMMEAQGYDLDPFDRWARQTYGQDYTTGKPKTVNMESVLALGYGPIGEDRLAQLLAAGEIEQYTRGDYIYYRKAGNSTKPKTGVVPKAYYKP